MRLRLRRKHNKHQHLLEALDKLHRTGEYLFLDCFVNNKHIGVAYDHEQRAWVLDNDGKPFVYLYDSDARYNEQLDRAFEHELAARDHAEHEYPGVNVTNVPGDYPAEPDDYYARRADYGRDPDSSHLDLGGEG